MGTEGSYQVGNSVGNAGGNPFDGLMPRRVNAKQATKIMVSGFECGVTTNKTNGSKL